MNPLEVYDVAGSVQQSRLARLLLADLDGDALHSVSVLSECLTDERGERVALNALLLAAVGALLEILVGQADVSVVADELRRRIAALELGEVDG